jgi:hypothetical protein
MSESTISAFPFLRLPREIRDQIYRLLLSARLTFTGDCKCINYSTVTPLIKFAPAILRANKQALDEASQILYCENDFVVLKVATRQYVCLDNFPTFVGLSEHQTPQPSLKITIKDLEIAPVSSINPLTQRTFIFTLASFQYFAGLLWLGAKMCDFYYSMGFALSIPTNAPSRRVSLINNTIRSLDQIQGFGELIFYGVVDAETLGHLTECMTLGQHLQDLCFGMEQSLNHGKYWFKQKKFILASRYWSQLKAFWVYRCCLLLRLRRTLHRTRFFSQRFHGSNPNNHAKNGSGKAKD